MFGLGHKTKMIEASDALPGRNDEIPVPERHAVLGTPLRPPFPEGMEQAVFGLGCFWGAERARGFVLLRRGLPPAVPGKEPVRILRPRWHRRQLPGRARRLPGLAAGHRRQDRHLIAVADGRLETVEEAYVLSAHVYVDEASQAAIFGDPAAELAIALIQGVEHLADRGAVDLRGGLAVGCRSQ